MLAIGDSKAGKTGALVSLVQAGYKLAIILDLDNLLDVLAGYINQKSPECGQLADPGDRRFQWRRHRRYPVA
jgi:hypothetical protein